MDWYHLLAMTVRQAKSKDLQDREDARQKEIAAQDKELKAQAEERFKTAIAALGDKNEATQVGGAILLRSFLNPEDKEIYGRYYAQIFDLAVAYLRPSTTSQPLGDSTVPLALTPLRQALIIVFKEAFPLARSQNKGDPQSLDASYIQLDNAFLWMADLKQAWMPQASLRKADLREANLREANLREADLYKADLSGADLCYASLSGADFRDAKVDETDFDNAKLYGADFNTDLSRARRLTREQIANCKVRDTIVDGNTSANPPESPVSPSSPSQQSS